MTICLILDERLKVRMLTYPWLVRIKMVLSCKCAITEFTLVYFLSMGLYMPVKMIFAFKLFIADSTHKLLFGTFAFFHVPFTIVFSLKLFATSSTIEWWAVWCMIDLVPRFCLFFWKPTIPVTAFMFKILHETKCISNHIKDKSNFNLYSPSHRLKFVKKRFFRYFLWILAPAEESKNRFLVFRYG